jgi:hypothetical protein
MEAERVRMGRVRATEKKQRRQALVASEQTLDPSISVIPLPPRRVIDFAKRVRAREAREASHKTEARRLRAELEVVGTSKAFILAIREAERLLLSPSGEPPSFDVLDGMCTTENDDDEIIPDPLFMARDGRPRLTRIFAGWTDGRGGNGERSNFLRTVKAHPDEAVRLAIVKEARALFWDRMRAVKALDRALAAQGWPPAAISAGPSDTPAEAIKPAPQPPGGSSAPPNGEGR